MAEPKEIEPSQSKISQFTSIPKVPISWGELIDKITILEIKAENINSKSAISNIVTELSLLRKIAEPVLIENAEIANFASHLRVINKRLWDIEDHIRRKDAAAEFDQEFIDLARSVYKNNDERGAIKRQINQKLGSGLMEEKSYKVITCPRPSNFL